MSSYFFLEADKNAKNANFIDALRDYSEVNQTLIYVLDRPLTDQKYSYKYSDALIVLSSKNKIAIINYGDNEEKFEDYVEDVVEDIGSIADKYLYKDVVGRPRIWRKSLLEVDLAFEEINNLNDFFNNITLKDEYDNKKLDLLISLFIGSINNIERVKEELPTTLLDKVKQKIQLFDGDQTRFIYQNPNKQKIRIQGLSGTGKTELLLHKLKDLYINDSNSKIFFTCHNKILADNLNKRIPDFFNFMKVEQQIEWNSRLWCTNAWGSNSFPNSGAYRYICAFYKIPFYRYTYQMSFSKACQLAINDIKEKYTEIQPKDKAEIVFNNDTALICHRSDGGSPNNCGEDTLLAVRGDYFQLYENGFSQILRLTTMLREAFSTMTYRASDVEPVFYDRFIKEGIVLGSGFDPANLKSNKLRAINYEEHWAGKAPNIAESAILYISDYETFTKVTKIDTNIDASYMQASVSSESSKSISESFTENNINILIHAYADYGVFGMKEGASLVPAAELLKNTNQQEFIKVYGSRFIIKEKRMNSISILITIRNVSKKFKSVVSSTFSAKVGYGGASVKAKQTINEEITKDSNSDRIELSAFTLGGEGLAGLKDIILPNLKNNSDAIEYINGLIKNSLTPFNEKNAIPYECSVADMRIFGLTEIAEIPWNYKRMQNMEKLKSIYSELSYHLSIYDKIKHRINPYYELLGGEENRNKYINWIEKNIESFKDQLHDIAVRHENCKININELSFEIPYYSTKLISGLAQLIPVNVMYTNSINNKYSAYSADYSGLSDDVMENLMNTVPSQRKIDLMGWIRNDEYLVVLLRFESRKRWQKVQIVKLHDSLDYKQNRPFLEGNKKTEFYNGPQQDFVLWNSEFDNNSCIEHAILEYIPKVHGNLDFEPFGLSVNVEYKYTLFCTLTDYAGREFTYKIMDLEMVTFHRPEGDFKPGVITESVIKNITYYIPTDNDIIGPF